MAENILSELVDRIAAEISLLNLEFEIILVEDASPDNSWKIIELLCKKYDFVKGIKLSRNFGQHYAVTAGIEESKGDLVVLMDCDLQDNPADIRELIDKYHDGYDIVFTKRSKRKHGIIKVFLSFIYQQSFKQIGRASCRERVYGSV